jgi:hypothetical protein
LLRQIPDSVKENHYTRLLARRLDISEQVIVAEKRRSSLGGKSAAIRAGMRPGTVEKTRRRSTEDYLVALLLKHHQLNYSLLAQIQIEDIQDARNREIIQLLQDPATFELQGDDLIIAMDDDLADHAEALLGSLKGRPEQFPSNILNETSTVLRKLGMERFRFLESQLHVTLREAEQSNDRDLVNEIKRQIGTLTQRRALYDPEPSPYFRDIRSKQTY